MENDNKIILDQVKEYFKNAVEVLSLGENKMLMSDFDFNTLEVSRNDVWIIGLNDGPCRIIYNIKTKEYAKILTTKQNTTILRKPSKNWLKDTIWSGGSSITPEILRELTEPKNEVMRLKVGGIYKGKETDTHFSALIKITKDDGKEICAYGFNNGKFDGKNEAWYAGGTRLKAIERLQETTIEKWEKALLKYKK